MSVNTIILLGRIGQDPTVNTHGDKKVANFSLATSDTYKDKTTGEKKEDTQWHKCVLWNHDNLIPYLTKGTQVYVRGSMKYGSYEKEKVTIPTAEVIIDEITLIQGGKKDKE